MLSAMKKSFLLFSLVLLLISAFILTACSPIEDSKLSRELCEELMGYVMTNDKNAAYGMVDEVASPESFDELWKYMRQIVRGSTSYEIKQEGWHWNYSNGVSTTNVTFKITTDDEKLFYLDIITSDGYEGLADLYCVDSTDFAESTSFLSVINIVMILLSFALIAFVICMVVDCIKRPIEKKVLWVVIILIWVTFTVTSGPGSSDFSFAVRIPLSTISVKADLYSHAISVRAAIPVGAVIYCIKRKSLALKETKSAPIPAEDSESEKKTDEDVAE